MALCEPFTATESATRGTVARPFEPRLDVELGALHAAHRTVSYQPAMIRAAGLKPVGRLLAMSSDRFG